MEYHRYSFIAGEVQFNGLLNDKGLLQEGGRLEPPTTGCQFETAKGERLYPLSHRAQSNSRSSGFRGLISRKGAYIYMYNG